MTDQVYGWMKDRGLAICDRDKDRRTYVELSPSSAAHPL